MRGAEAASTRTHTPSLAGQKMPEVARGAGAITPRSARRWAAV